MSGIWSLTTLCRCCHADGTFKSLDSPYKVDNSVEIYTEMLKNTLGVCLQSPALEVSFTICDVCITELRDASKFKKQVLQCEEKFKEYCNNELLQHMEVKMEKETDIEIVIKPEVKGKAEDVNDENEVKKECIERETIDIIYEPDYHSDDEVDVTEEQTNDVTELTVESNPKQEKSKVTGLKLYKKVKTKNGIKYSCLKCSETLDKYAQLRLHINKNHPQSYVCTVCNEKFTIYNKYTRHSRIHRPKTHKCEHCDKSYKTIESLKYHLDSHTKSKQFICDICTKVFLHRNSIRKHMLWHMGLNKKIVCDICGHLFNDLTNLNIHKAAVHDKCRPYKCGLCPKDFAAKKNLIYHMRYHTGERPYTCDICQRGFVNYSYLKKHLTIHEVIKDKQKAWDGKGRYVCKFCAETFDHRGLYTSHIRKHDIVKPYSCDTCGKSFCTRYTLNRHVETHVGIKRFPCDQCGQFLSTKSLLKRHIERIHDPNRVFKTRFRCEICKMSVTDMEKHMKSHTNKRFKCDSCFRSYSERNALHRHIKQAHSGINYPCDVCGRVYVKKGSLKTKSKLINVYFRKSIRVPLKVIKTYLVTNPKQSEGE